MARTRKLSDVLKRGYSDQEIHHIYELARFNLENGQIAKAETILKGLVAVAPEFVPAYLGLTYIDLLNDNFDSALHNAKEAHKFDPSSPIAAIFLVTVLISIGDFTTAGSHLGEVGDVIETSPNQNSNLVRFYRAQLARFKNLA